MIFTTILYFLIGVAVCLYLYVDGKTLGLDLLAAVAFTLLVLWVVGLAVCCTTYLATMLVIGPVLRLLFRVDTAKWNNAVVPWLIKRLNTRWLDKVQATVEKTKKEQAKEERIKKGYHAGRH